MNPRYTATALHLASVEHIADDRAWSDMTDAEREDFYLDEEIAAQTTRDCYLCTVPTGRPDGLCAFCVDYVPPADDFQPVAPATSIRTPGGIGVSGYAIPGEPAAIILSSAMGCVEVQPGDVAPLLDAITAASAELAAREPIGYTLT